MGSKKEKKQNYIVIEDSKELLNKVHINILNCYKCKSQVGETFHKTDIHHRGDAGRVVIIGQQPGKQEIKKGLPFSGKTGQRLDSWLIECGANPLQPREGIYTTSIVKCYGGKKHLKLMSSNCENFLSEQLRIIKPELIITLGKHAFFAIDVSRQTYAESLCKLYPSKNHILFTNFGFHYIHLPWPHPSGLNRWHNSPSNKKLLTASFEFVKEYLNVL